MDSFIQLQKRFWILAAVPVFAAIDAQALTIVLNDTTPGGMNPAALTGFQQAAGRWQSLFSDPATVRIDIGFQSLGAGILGQAGSSTVGISYSNVKAALSTDASSASDATAVANLPGGSYLSFLTTPPGGGASVLDANQTANNWVLDVNRANAKALGLLADNGSTDASITFSSDYTFDFNPLDGIGGGMIDFVGVATHEIGHALGFVSGVDTVDVASGSGPYAPVNLDPYRVFSVLDLYRYSTASLAAGAGVLDLAVGDSPYFSINGGTTALGGFSTGAYNGDGRQASHWKDNQMLGIMDPTIAYGELGVISALDIQAFDVIGWDLAATPDSMATLQALGLAFISLLALNRRRSAVGG